MFLFDFIFSIQVTYGETEGYFHGRNPTNETTLYPNLKFIAYITGVFASSAYPITNIGFETEDSPWW